MEFSMIKIASTNQAIRAWSLEQALNTADLGESHEDTICFAKMIETYVRDGDVSSVITAAVEEGYSEGRFQVKQAVEEWYSNIDLDDLFKTKGWIPNARD